MSQLVHDFSAAGTEEEMGDDKVIAMRPEPSAVLDIPAGATVRVCHVADPSPVLGTLRTCMHIPFTV